MIRIGLLGASRIAIPAILEPVKKIEGIDVTAIAARTFDRASAFANKYDIRHVDKNYTDLIENKNVDLIYIGLPPSCHASWSIAALEAGKHVVCEKPFAMNTQEALQMVDKANETGKVLIEAFHYRFHPLFNRVLKIINSGEIGVVQKVAARFDTPIPFQPGELRHNIALGGGALMDLGCYPVHWVRTLLGKEPRVVSARASLGQPDVDISMDAVLDFSSNVIAKVGCSMAAWLPNKVNTVLSITGENGCLRASNLLAPNTGSEIVLQKNGDFAKGIFTKEKITGETTYYYQLQHVKQTLLGERCALTGGADSVANMLVIDEIYRAASMLPRGLLNKVS